MFGFYAFCFCALDEIGIQQQWHSNNVALASYFYLAGSGSGVQMLEQRGKFFSEFLRALLVSLQQKSLIVDR